MNLASSLPIGAGAMAALPAHPGASSIGAAAFAGVLARVLDEIDYGVVLVTVGGALRHANQIALRALHANARVRLGGGMVFAPREAEQIALKDALAEAGRGLRRLLTLGSGAQSVSIAVVPMSAGYTSHGASAASGQGAPLVMLLLGKQASSETLTLDFFARAQRLTATEATVLHALCAGRQPKEIARQAGVAISTVRTQIGSIRTKTQTRSIRDLINKVATLPPITPAMKTAVCH